jgi:uncharacterized membrane-anchored protein
MLIAAGLIFYLLSKFGFTRMPGDISAEGKNWKFYFPLGTCILISVVLTLLMWLINYFLRK